jgi:hypothetical protein
MTFFAYPGTHHPALEGIAKGVRGAIDAGNRHDIVYPVPSKPVFAREIPTAWEFEPMKTKTMRVERCAGPAPYVGRPFCYTWRAAVDDVGRWVGGTEVELQYIAPEWWDLDPKWMP